MSAYAGKDHVLRSGPDGRYVVRTGIYLLPDPLASHEDWARYHGFDLAGVDELRLWSEEQTAGHALATLVSSGADAVIYRDEDGRETWAIAWLKGRVRLCHSERTRIKEQAQS